jgi:alkyl hydroperoxide reductase subunit AhpC
MLKGTQAPNFSLFSSDKEKITLSDLIGKDNILILFFPQAFTGVCTKELCSIRDHIKDYQDLNTEVIGISVDSVFTQDKYKQDEKFNFLLLSDFNKEVSTLYGSIYDSFTDMGMKGVSKRSAFVIDKQGVIQYEEILESAGDIPNFADINETLKSLK